MWGAYLHNRIPRQRLEPQALALLGKHSTTELPCQLSYTSACSCYVHLSAVVMCICMQLLCASTCSCYMRLYAVVMCVWMKLSYASAYSCHVHLRAVVSYTVAINSYTIFTVSGLWTRFYCSFSHMSLVFPLDSCIETQTSENLRNTCIGWQVMRPCCKHAYSMYMQTQDTYIYHY